MPYLSLINKIRLKEFMKTSRFLELVKDYQNKIIDWQIEWSRVHNSGGMLFYFPTDAEEKTEQLCEEVLCKLTTMLKMDEEIVRKRLKERKEDIKKSHQRGIDAVKDMKPIPTLPDDYEGGIDADGDI